VQYNMFHRDRVELEYVHLFNRYKLGTAIWSPLASGILTGKHNEKIAEDSRLALKENAPIAKKVGGTPAQLALAWCMKQPHIDTVITGVSKPEQMEENLRAMELVSKLTPEILQEIEEVLDNQPTPIFNFRDS
ncbi:11045_t:CDS:2, partial [Acaulospora morrowiae]